jgi:hypothetical protein
MAETFSDLAERAQILHGEREFAQAALTWELAEAVAPDAMELARVQRGRGSSLWRVSQNTSAGSQTFLEQAYGLIESALKTHDQAVSDTPDQPGPLRERAESRAILGRMMIGEVISSELDGNVGDPAIRQDGLSVVTGVLDPAKADVTAAEALTGKTDQHDINMLARLGMAHSLYGAWASGSIYSFKALALGARSESPRVHLPAGLSIPHVGRAKMRATGRGAAAVAVFTLATTLNPNARRLALRVAQRTL